MRRAIRALALLLCTTFLACGLSGCESQDTDKIEKHEKKTARAPVDLPPKPNLDSILNAPRQHPDGALTVTGLILDKNQYFGTNVMVRGVVREVSEDCPFKTDPKEKENRPKPGEYRRMCKVVSVTLADSSIAPKELLIINYPPYLHPHLKPGTEMLVKGNYDIEAGGFVRPRDGLLLVEEVLNLYVDDEGNFFNDPEEVRLKKEEQAALEAEAAAERERRRNEGR